MSFDSRKGSSENEQVSNNPKPPSSMRGRLVGVCLDWGVLKSICIVVNVYSKCKAREKGVNILERGLSLSTKMVEFGSFLEDLELVDLPLLGRCFTWYHSSGRSISRIDRILILDE
ncbi:putative reverse transcriptase - beet retrotransposon [Trifolium medium]|uniref:Putative reverse transcriptase-beet retrotransposon n=1 Tax=Trifolium medium TaxID=97028 RepID=A0A392MP26_9FABA|nr:putative reverse transcriptase - beet retrotransposon [Trifolium medium]